MAALLGMFGRTPTQDRTICRPACRLCRLPARGARLIPGHHPRSGLAGGEVLDLVGRAESIFPTMFPWKMWTRFWPATESGVGAVSRCLPAPKLCVLSRSEEHTSELQ